MSTTLTSELTRPVFQPLPLLGNPHVQTFLGAYLPGPSLQAKQMHIVRLADGDALLVHENCPTSWQAGDPIALILHGLGGSASSPHVQRMAYALQAHGVRVARLDLRGAGQGIALARGFYHGGRSDDIRAVLQTLHEWSPLSPLLLVGLSLGGNLALRVAGELHQHPVANLTRVAALSPPIDLERCQALLASPANRVYEDMFVRIVVSEARQRQRLFPDLPPLRLPPGRIGFRTFDELYTAPRCGFADAIDYYRKASPQRLIPHIPIPALIITSRDDPFIAIEPFESLRLPDHIQLHIVPAGGHIGFVGWDRTGGVRWAERWIVDWLLQERLAA